MIAICLGKQVTCINTRAEPIKISSALFSNQHRTDTVRSVNTEPITLRK